MESDVLSTQELPPSPKSTLLVDPNRKFAFCYFPKVASNVFNTLFMKLNGKSKHEFDGHRFGAMAAEKLGIARDQITHENGWKFGVFVRDPLSRFLSAFGSKCLPKPNGEPGAIHSCPGILGQGKKDGWPIVVHPAPLDEMVSAFEKYAVHFNTTLHTKDGKLLTDNRHYMRQMDLAIRCGEEKFLPGHGQRLDFVGWLTGDVQGQVKSMLKIADTEGSLNIDKIAERYFPSDRIRGQHNSEEYTVANFYRNRTIKQMVFEMYKIDYDTFGLPYPKDLEDDPVQGSRSLWSRIVSASKGKTFIR